METKMSALLPAKIQHVGGELAEGLSSATGCPPWELLVADHGHRGSKAWSGWAHGPGPGRRWRQSPKCAVCTQICVCVDTCICKYSHGLEVWTPSCVPHEECPSFPRLGPTHFTTPSPFLLVHCLPVSGLRLAPGPQRGPRPARRSTLRGLQVRF